MINIGLILLSQLLVLNYRWVEWLYHRLRRAIVWTGMAMIRHGALELECSACGERMTSRRVDGLLWQAENHRCPGEVPSGAEGPVQ